MIEIGQLKRFSELAVASIGHLEDYILIVNEADFKNQLSMIKGYPVLVTVLPSGKGDDRGWDNYAESNEALFYVLAPCSEKLTKDERIGVWETTQEAMKELKEFIRKQMTEQQSVFYGLLQDAAFDKRSIEPEYNFLGNIGWSLVFDFTTEGL